MSPDGIEVPTVNGSNATADGQTRTQIHGDDRELMFKLAEACRILAHAGLAEDILGHVSARAPQGDSVLVRSRSPQERGLLFTTPGDIHEIADHADALPDGYRRPNEFPIHSRVLRARPDATAVVHVHPPAVVACELAGLALRPIVGAYNIPAMRMANDGFPIYPRSVLINTDELGDAVAATLGERPVCILRGHGIVTVGDSIEQAVVRAVNIEILARMTLAASQHGVTPPELPAQDIADMPDLGSMFNDTYVWQYHRSRLELAGLDLPR